VVFDLVGWAMTKKEGFVRPGLKKVAILVFRPFRGGPPFFSFFYAGRGRGAMHMCSAVIDCGSRPPRQGDVCSAESGGRPVEEGEQYTTRRVATVVRTPRCRGPRAWKGTIAETLPKGSWDCRPVKPGSAKTKKGKNKRKTRQDRAFVWPLAKIMGGD